MRTIKKKVIAVGGKQVYRVNSSRLATYLLLLNLSEELAEDKDTIFDINLLPFSCIGDVDFCDTCKWLFYDVLKQKVGVYKEVEITIRNKQK